MPRRKKPSIVKFAVFGCGEMGNLHIANLMANESAEIVCIYNNGIENLQKTGKKAPKARMYQDYNQMILKEKFDAAVIALAPEARGEIEKLCCAKGIHLFLENPLGLDQDTVESINDAIKYSNIISSVNFQERYTPAIQIVREILQKEPVGIVQAYNFSPSPVVEWQRFKERSGGQIVVQGGQVIDMLRYLLGEVDSIYAKSVADQRFNTKPHTSEDYSSAIISFKSGTIVSFQAGSYIKEQGIVETGFEIVTSRCVIKYIWGKYLRVSTGERTEELKLSTDTHKVALDTFVEAVLTGDRLEIKSSYEDAIKSFFVTLLANSSIENDIPVKIQQS